MGGGYGQNVNESVRRCISSANVLDTAPACVRDAQKTRLQQTVRDRQKQTSTSASLTAGRLTISMSSGEGFPRFFCEMMHSVLHPNYTLLTHVAVLVQAWPRRVNDEAILHGGLSEDLLC
jgi:hypothetical protein